MDRIAVVGEDDLVLVDGPRPRVATGKPGGDQPGLGAEPPEARPVGPNAEEGVAVRFHGHPAVAGDGIGPAGTGKVGSPKPPAAPVTDGEQKRATVTGPGRPTGLDAQDRCPGQIYSAGADD